MLKIKDDPDIDNTFPNELGLAASQNLILYCAYFTNYLVNDMVLENLLFLKCKKFMHDGRKFIWDESYLF